MRDHQRGMVTAELATGLLAVVVVAGALLQGSAVLVQQVSTQDVAAQAARQLARHDTKAVDALMAAHPGATLTQGRDGDLVVVTVRFPGRATGLLPAIATTGRATAVEEPAS